MARELETTCISKYTREPAFMIEKSYEFARHTTYIQLLTINYSNLLYKWIEQMRYIRGIGKYFIWLES